MENFFRKRLFASIGGSGGGGVGPGTPGFIPVFTGGGTTVGDSSAEQTGTSFVIHQTAPASPSLIIESADPGGYLTGLDTTSGFATILIGTDAVNTNGGVIVISDTTGTFQTLISAIGISTIQNVGIGNAILIPTNTRLEITGTNDAATDYGIIVNSNTVSDLFFVRNDGIAYFGGFVGFGYPTPTAPVHIECVGLAGIKMLVNGGNPDRFSMFLGDGSGGTAAEEIYFDMINSAFHFRGNATAATEHFYISGGNTGNGSGRISACYAGTSATNFNNSHFSIQTSNATDGSALDILNDTTGGGTIYASKHIITGANSENVAGLFQATGGTLNYALKLDGWINLLNYPTSDAGLVAGDIYVDTAANALVNNDLLMIVKQ